MNRQFRIISAFKRGLWLIEPTFAYAHFPLIDQYLAGQFNPKLLEDEKDGEEDSEDPLTRVSYAVAASTGNNTAPSTQTRYSLDDPELPDNSVFVLNIEGTILKKSTCCSIGTEEYCSLLEQAYANEKIIGIVCLVDSPGGQLSGTPTLYDTIRSSTKPVISVIDNGMMASAAYWLACGSDEILATQKADQVGSIGVYVQFDDYTEYKKKMGITTHSIYSDRSSEKNLPYKEALDGKPELLKAELNQAADLFREAVEEGRGEKIKPVKKDGKDVFKGGLFYASEAIELGLIDGFGNLSTAVNRVVELHNERQSTNQSAAPRSGYAAKPTAAAEVLATPQVTTQETPAPAGQEPSAIADAPPSGASTDAPELSDNQPDSPPVESEATQSPTPNPNQSMSSIFGFTRIAALSAIAGVAADQITQEQIDAINAEFQSQAFNVAVISQAQFAEIQQLQGQLTTATNTIAARDAEITRLGKQPGATPTKVQKEEEKITEESESTLILSETDQMLADQKAKMQPKKPA